MSCVELFTLGVMFVFGRFLQVEKGLFTFYLYAFSTILKIYKLIFTEFASMVSL